MNRLMRLWLLLLCGSVLENVRAAQGGDEGEGKKHVAQVGGGLKRKREERQDDGMLVSPCCVMCGSEALPQGKKQKTDGDFEPERKLRVTPGWRLHYEIGKAEESGPYTDDQRVIPIVTTENPYFKKGEKISPRYTAYIDDNGCLLIATDAGRLGPVIGHPDDGAGRFGNLELSFAPGMTVDTLYHLEALSHSEISVQLEKSQQALYGRNNSHLVIEKGRDWMSIMRGWYNSADYLEEALGKKIKLHTRSWTMSGKLIYERVDGREPESVTKFNEDCPDIVRVCSAVIAYKAHLQVVLTQLIEHSKKNVSLHGKQYVPILSIKKSN